MLCFITLKHAAKTEIIKQISRRGNANITTHCCIVIDYII